MAPPKSVLQHVPGVQLAVVLSTADPNGRGRVQIEFPWLDSAPLWAQACMTSGPTSDTAVVAFQGGDWMHPIIIGYLKS